MTRLKVVALVASLSALGGAVAGTAAAAVAAAVLGPRFLGAALIAEVIGLNGLVGAVAGSVLGTVVAFGALRRVPLGRLLLCTNIGLAAGFTVSWLGGPWADQNFGLLGFLGFSAGAIVARAMSRGSPRDDLRPDALTTRATIGAAEANERKQLSSTPGSTSKLADRAVNHARRGEPKW